MSRRRRLKQKEIEGYLQDLDGFERPKIHLEQYATQPHVASMVLYTIDTCYDDTSNKVIADLGCGEYLLENSSGSLTIASLLTGAHLVYGFDIDHEALQTCLANAKKMFKDDEDDDEDSSYCEDIDLKSTYSHCPNLNIIEADIVDNDGFWYSFKKKFDVSITNPPFGTKHNKGIDMLFLRRAINLATESVYSLHKSSTRDYIKSKCKQWQVSGEPIAQIRYDLPNTYRFHQKKSVDVEVDLWRITSLPQDPI